MYHVELRQFPHNLCRFNLSEQEVHSAIVEPWAREQWVELGERKWSPHQAKLTVLEGPELQMAQLSMGRGWRTAQRQCADVTERLLAAARAAAAGPAHVDVVDGAAGVAPDRGAVVSDRGAVVSDRGAVVSDRGAAVPERGVLAATGELQPHADSLGLQLLAALGSGSLPLRRAWELAAAAHPARAPSESLALAELAVRSLLRSDLIELSAARPGGAGEDALAGQALESSLYAISSWVDETESGALWLRRS